MHPNYGELPWPYVPVRVTHGALEAHLYTYSIPCGTILLHPYSMVWDWLVSRAVTVILYLSNLVATFYVFYGFHFLFFVSIGWYCGAGVFGLIGCKSLSPRIAFPTTFNKKNNNNKF